jgi:hypothetical protein
MLYNFLQIEAGVVEPTQPMPAAEAKEEAAPAPIFVMPIKTAISKVMEGD